METIKTYFPGGLMTFKKRPEDFDAIDEQAVLVELVDTENGEIELAFDAARSNRRVYLRMKIRDVEDALAQAKKDQP